MSLLNRIQERAQQQNDSVTEPGLEAMGDTAHQAKVDIRAVFRDPKKEGVNPEVQRKQDKHQELKNLIHKQILQEFKDAPVEEIIPRLDGMAIEIMKDDEQFRGSIDRKKVVDELKNDLTGFGPINPLLMDEDVSEVMVNGPTQVYCERKGKIEMTSIKFRDDEHVMSIIEKIVAPLG